MSDSAGFPKIRFSTAALPQPDRVARWREHYAHTIFRAEVQPACAASFQAAVIFRALPQLQLLSGALSAVRIERTREFLADGNDDVALIINRAGLISAIARGREVTLREGDAVLINSGEMGVFDRLTAGGSFSIRIPRSVLSPLVVDLDDAVMRLIPRCASALRLLASYAGPLLEQDVLETPELQRLAVTHVHDLVALVLGATRDAGDVAHGRGRGAALLRAAKAFIVENSSTPSLSIGSVAQHLGVTPRYLQKLFETDGATFSNFLLGRRLARAHRMLTNPGFDASQVSAIAYDAGFGDLSYFNRNFRHRYGATPREVRKSRAR
jgi:AraC-like DNA-binding protein